MIKNTNAHLAQHLLVLNAGSSSLKFALYEANSLGQLARGQISGVGRRPVLESGEERQVLDSSIDFATSVPLLLAHLNTCGFSTSNICCAGHRIVHGGERYVEPSIVHQDDLETLDGLRRLAPLHLPFGLRVLRAARDALPGVPQVACFDTAFHASQPAMATLLPLPRVYREKGYRRYGFHGLSYAHVVYELPRLTGKPVPQRLLAAHLGSGASMCAILDGKSVATTMGFSTADGLVMGTRTGSIDPGVVMALLRDEKLSLDALEDLLYRNSGLLGLSGISPDMRDLLASPQKAARDAVDYYCYSAARHAASLVPTLGGIDAVVFTGGVGENAEPVRRSIMAHLRWLNVPHDAIHVVQANEELTIARAAVSLLGYTGKA
jgi:acetate kinase